MSQAVAAKYGVSAEGVEAGHLRMAALGREAGFVFDFERVQLGCTFDAHRLAQAARGGPCETSLVKALFVAYFSEGRLLSDHQVLREVAVSAGMDARRVDRVLGSSAFSEQVRADEAAALELDVMGVPYFLINGAWPVPGAQDVETMVAILRRACSRQ